MENGIQMTLEEFMPEISQKQIVGASDSHALISQWQDAAKESLKERVHRSFSELCNFLDKPQKRKDPLTCSSRMLRICFLLMEDGISPEFSLRWMRGGYDAEWEVLNSKNFNVPQNRERIFIIGHLRGRSTTEVFPVEGTNRADSVCGVIGHREGFRRNTQVFDRGGITETLDTGQGGGRGHHTIEVIGTLDKNRHSQMDVVGSGGGASDINDSEGVSESGIIVVGNTNPSGKGMNGNCYFSEGTNPTLTCNKQEGNRIAIPVEVKPEVIGGIGEKSFGQQYPQGNRIYDGDKIATALQSNPVGNSGGSTNLYSMDVTGYNATLNEGGV